MNRRSVAAAALAVLLGGTTVAADGVAGSGHAFRADIVIVRGTKVLLLGLTAPADGERCRTDAGVVACADAAREALDAFLADHPVSCTFARKVG
ncbi:MAG: hypothetical protein ACREE7_17980, partial [Dongiaceae bacterium]